MPDFLAYVDRDGWVCSRLALAATYTTPECHMLSNPTLPADDARYVGVSQALRSYMRRVHAPLLRRPAVKAAVLAVFGGIFLFSCAALPRLER